MNRAGFACGYITHIISASIKLRTGAIINGT